jgi:hypothetical protein
MEEDPGSSVGTVSDYGLENRGSMLERSRGLILQSVPGTGPTHWVPGLKRGRSVMLTTHYLILPRLRKPRVIPPVTTIAIFDYDIIVSYR